MKDTMIYIARFIVETATPLAVGTGDKGLITDRLIARDANGLPYIPGSSLAGVVRHELREMGIEKADLENLFGFQNEENGAGSRINFSPALLVSENGSTVIEGLQKIDFTKDYYSYFKRLPERDHVRMTHKGTADTKGHGKYDEELVHKGTRFVFEIELEGIDNDEKLWNKVLYVLNHPAFRVGSGTRKGFGKLKIIEYKKIKWDIGKKDDLNKYLSKSSSLNAPIGGFKEYEQHLSSPDKKWIEYEIELKPDIFFIFGAGIGDEDVDIKPKTEKYFDWSNGKPELTTDKILVPATSIKGIISHRVAYHYNKDTGRTIENTGNIDLELDFNTEEAINNFDFEANVDDLDIHSSSSKWREMETKISAISFADLKKSLQWQELEEEMEEKENDISVLGIPVGEFNDAVKTLFGYAKAGNQSGARGKVVFSDVYLKKDKEKIFNHVAIDRFTGGGIDGALYDEKVVNTREFVLNIFVEKNAFRDKKVKKAFESTLDDLISGKLQLGGNTTKGHGAFSGNWETKSNKYNE